MKCMNLASNVWSRVRMSYLSGMKKIFLNTAVEQSNIN
jgi:hypothetical protein